MTKEKANVACHLHLLVLSSNKTPKQNSFSGVGKKARPKYVFSNANLIRARGVKRLGLLRFIDDFYKTHNSSGEVITMRLFIFGD